MNTESAFTLLLRVRYGECDAQQVVFNPRYADYVDVAATEYFRTLFGGYDAFLDRGLDNQVVKLELQWQSSARFDDVLRIQVKTLRVGNTSYSFEITMIHDEENRPVAKAEIVYVLVDATEFHKLQVPNDVRETLLAGAPNVVVNQAGVTNTQ